MIPFRGKATIIGISERKKNTLTGFRQVRERRSKMVRFDTNYTERRKSLRIFPDAVNGVINIILTGLVLTATVMFYVCACNIHDIMGLIARLFV